jgi:cytochrome c oxidase subunit 2
MQRFVILIAAIVAIMSCSAIPIPAAATQAASRHVEVTARKFAFQPAELTLQKGQQVDLVLKSADVAHGLRFHELNLDIKVNKGATADVRFTPDKAGTFIGHCSVFCGSGHGQMTLTIRVVE